MKKIDTTSGAMWLKKSCGDSATVAYVAWQSRSSGSFPRINGTEFDTRVPAKVSAKER